MRLPRTTSKLDGMLRPMRALLRRLRGRRELYEPLIEVRISRENALHNLHAFREHFPKLAIAPVLKANAYGAGLSRLASIYERENIPFFCVDSHYEARVLRAAGIMRPILIMGYTPIETVMKEQPADTAFTMLSLEELARAASTISAKTRIHIKVDTGMHRHGIAPSEVSEALALVASNPHLELEGVFTHFADADTPDSSMTARQIKLWNETARAVRREVPDIRYLHCAATAGSYFANSVDANVMRIGKGLHGFTNSLEKLDLRPILEMRTRISSVRDIAASEHVGYNGTFTASRAMKIATIPAGYYEGIDRRLSNKGSVLVRGVACPIIGRVSMNITTIDVSALDDVTLDDEATIISKNPADPNSIENIAKLCGTIPHEVLVHLPAHLRRRIV